MRYIQKQYHILWIVTICFIALLVQPVTSMAQIYKSKHGHVQFFSKSTLENFTGRSNYLVGQINLADSTVQFYVDLTTISTGVKLRDEHMREEYLQTDKYPFAQFSGKIVSPFNPASTDTQQVTVKGKFKVHGVTRQISVKGSMVVTPQKLFVKAAWPVMLKDYKIKIPEVLFMKVSEKQAVSIKATLDRIQKKKS